MSAPPYDLLVIGGGSAGLAAAVSAAQAGASVHIVEKLDVLGGPNRVNPSSLGMFAFESWMQKELHVDVSMADGYRILMEHTRWQADGRTVSALVRGAAPTIEWFNDLGVNFDKVIAYYTGGHQVWHIRDTPWDPIIADLLEAEALRRGVTWRLETTAEELLVEEGRVVGAVVRDADGLTDIRARNTYVSTGGFQGSPALIQELTGFRPGEDLFTFEMFTHAAHAGEGLKMAWDAGAARSATMLETYIYLPDPFGGPGGTAPPLSVLRQPNLLVNQNGQRFIDEGQVRNPADAADAVRKQPGSYAYMIISDPVERELRENGLDYDLYGMYHKPGSLPALGDQVREAVATGYENLFVADTLEDLAAQLDIPASVLATTVSEYDAYCVRGVDGEFFKNAKYLRPLGAEGPYYAAKFRIGSYGSAGGIQVNEHGQALDDNGAPVPGLYAGGRDANDVYGATYPFTLAGAISTYSFTMGRLSGLHVAAQVAEEAAARQPVDA